MLEPLWGWTSLILSERAACASDTVASDRQVPCLIYETAQFVHTICPSMFLNWTLLLSLRNVSLGKGHVGLAQLQQQPDVQREPEGLSSRHLTTWKLMTSLGVVLLTPLLL